MHEMMTPEEVAAHFYISVDSVNRFIRQGALHAQLVGPSYRVPWEEFEAFRRSVSAGTLPIDVLFTLALEPATIHNPDGDGDAFLEELEREDERARRSVTRS